MLMDSVRPKQDPEIKKWLSEIEEIDDEISDLSLRRVEIIKGIHAKVDLEAARGKKIDAALLARIDKIDKGKTMVDAIVEILTEAEEPLSPKDILAGLPALGISKVVRGYIYTSLSRLVAKGTIKRDSHGLYTIGK